MFKRLMFFLVSLVVSVTLSLVVTWFAYLRPLRERWGVVPDETGSALPGDDLVADATLIETRGITVNAPPAEVWPWLVQMGYGRAGWYSYDQMDNDARSADRIMPELQGLSVGDLMPTWPGGGFRVADMEPGQSMSLYLDSQMVAEQQHAADPDHTEASAPGLKVAGGLGGAAMPEFKASWTFVLEPIDDGAHTRLVERLRAWTPKPNPLHKVALPMFGVGVFLMTRKQLLGIKERVERPATTGPLGKAA
jgi:hypothetical protein